MVAASCDQRATVADHIVPSSLDMADFEFYALSNLRASCKRHNTARGVAARLEREVNGNGEPPAVRSRIVRHGGFLRGAGNIDRPLVKSPSPSLVSRDYTRQPPEDAGT
jgi:hypothetical protein